MNEALFPILGDNCVFRETFQDMTINNGTLTNIVLSDGRAIFNGSNSNIDYPLRWERFGGALDLSVRMILKFSALTGAVLLSNPTVPLFFLYYTGSKLQFKPGSGDTIDVDLELEINREYEIIVTKYGVAYVLYLDGIALGAQALNGLASGPVRAGAWHDGSLSLNGSMESIEFFNRALTAEEVENIYKKRHHLGPVRDGLCASYDFSEGNAEDFSGHEHDGTLTAGDGGYKHGLGLYFDGAVTKVEVGDLDATIKTIGIVARINSTTEELLDLNGTNKMTITGGTLACGGFSNVFIGNATASTVAVDGLFHYLVVTDSTGVLASDFDIGENAFDGFIYALHANTEQLSLSEIAQNYQHYKTRFNLA